MVGLHPLDDNRINDNDDLLRRIPPSLYDPADNIPTPDAFSPRPQDKEGISVYVAKLISFLDAMKQVSSFPNYKQWKLASFEASIPRKEGLFVRMSPGREPSHAQIGDVKMLKSLKIRYKLARASKFVNWQEEPQLKE